MNHDSADGSGRGPLSWAAENGHDNIVGVLLQQNDTSPDTADESGRTPYPSPTRNGYRRVVSGQAVSHKLLFISGLEEELSRPFATDPFPLPELLLKNICRLSYIYYTTGHKLPPSFAHAKLSLLLVAGFPLAPLSICSPTSTIRLLVYQRIYCYFLIVGVGR